MSRKQLALLEPTLVRQALLDAVKKLSPMVQWRNPVMFIVWVGSLLTTLLAIAMAGGALTGSATFTAAVSIWLWFTVLFANFAEAMAEGRSKAQANSLKGVKKTAFARKLRAPQHDAPVDHVPAEDLRQRRRGAGGSRGYYPLRWRSHRRRRLGGRKRHYRRVCPGDP